MNGDGNMTPLNTQYQNIPFGNDGGNRTAGVSPSPPTPVSPYPPLTRYQAGSPHFSPGPRATTQPPLPTLPQTSLSSTSFYNSLPPVHSSPSSSRRDTLPPMYPSPSSSRRDPLPPLGPSSSSSRRDSSPHFSSGPWPVTQPAPVPPSLVNSSLRPVCPSSSSSRHVSSPHFNSGPRSVTQPSPVFSSLAPSPANSSLPQVCPSSSSSRRDSSPHFNSGPPSVTQPTPMFSSLPPSPMFSSLPPSPMFSSSLPSPMFSSLPPSPVFSSSPPSPVNSSLPPVCPSPSSSRRDSSPHFNSGPRPVTQQAPTFSSLPPSPVYSSLPPVASSSSSVRRHSLPPMYPPPLPPRVTVTRTRKSQKQTEGNISTGINSRIALDPPESSRAKEDDAVKWIYDKKAMKEYCSNDGVNNRFKTTGPSTSGVKRRAGKAIDPLTRHYESVPMDSCFNDMLRQSPSPPANLPPLHGTQTIPLSFNLGNGDHTPDDSKRQKTMMANRESAAKSRQTKLRYIRELKETRDKLMHEDPIWTGRLTVLEEEVPMLKTEQKEMTTRIESLEQILRHDKIQRLNLSTALNGQESVNDQRLKETMALHQQLKEEMAVTQQLYAEIERLKLTQNHAPFDVSYMLQPPEPDMSQQLTQNHAQFDVSNMQSLDLDMSQQLMQNDDQFEESNMEPVLELDLEMIQQLLQTDSQFDELNMQQPDPNMSSQQLNINQFNQPQPNFDFHGQI